MPRLTINIMVSDEVYKKLDGVNVSAICKRAIEDYAKYLDKDVVRLVALKRVEELYLSWLVKADKEGERVKTSVAIPVGILKVLKKRNINVSKLVSELLYIYLKDDFDEFLKKKYEEVKEKREEFERDIKIDMLFGELRELAKKSESEELFLKSGEEVVRELKELDVDLDEEYLRTFYKMMR